MIQQSHFRVCIQRIWSQNLRYLHSHSHSGTIYNSQNMETTQVSINGSLEKEDVVYVCMLLLSHFSRVRLCATPQTAAHQAPVPGILQVRTLEWVAISFSNAWK